jgi:methionyl-tRNA synthetase
MTSFYITTPIYYVNDAPHLGHAYTTIAADALARFHRMRGDATRFLTGTDEHGLKIEQAAAARGLGPQALADEVVERFRATWKNLGIGNDDFIRTTEPRHKTIVADMWRRMVAAGDIYLGAYEGWYCVSCEAYYTEGQLEPGKLCPTHKKEVSWLSEPTYFFRLGRYQDQLLAHIERHPGFIQPTAYRNEVVSFVKSGLRDLSVSRTTFQWGIPVPDDPAHIIYVWIDALTNYYSALSEAGGEDLRPAFWNADRGGEVVHLIGKDILKFHAVYWPCMLLSAGLPLPSTILCHGWWTVRGEKISKSMPATRVDPNQLAADLGADVLRYFVLREVPLGLDGDFTYEALIGRYNAELANDLGNLVSRCLTMTQKFAAGAVPSAAGVADFDQATRLRDIAAGAIDAAERAYAEYAPSRALEVTWKLVRETNGFVEAMQPWKLAREAASDPAAAGRLALTVRSFLEAIAVAARLCAPVMPGKSREILRALGVRDDELVEWPSIGEWRNQLTEDAPITVAAILFPRIDAEREHALLEAWIPPDARVAAAPEASAAKSGREPTTSTSTSTSTLTRVRFEDFARMELRVAEVKAAEAIKGARKLLRLELDVGDDRPRQVVAGIAERYAAEALIGKKVIFLANLEPATICGGAAGGGVLAAGGDQVIGLSAVDVDVPPGTVVR